MHSTFITAEIPNAKFLHLQQQALAITWYWELVGANLQSTLDLWLYLSTSIVSCPIEIDFVKKQICQRGEKGKNERIK